MTDRLVLVPGATSMVGQRVVPMLLGAGWQVVGVSRRPPSRPNDPVRWVSVGSPLPAVGAVLSLLPVWALHSVLDAMPEPQPRRVVALSSTSVLTKDGSSDAREQEVVRLLRQGEQQLRQWCDVHGVDWVILRPTLIYGASLDQNVTAIARVISRWRCFPVIGDGAGLRQPVHVDDVAAACVAALDAPVAVGRTYALSGAETLTYRRMVERIFTAGGRAPRVLRVPGWLARSLVRCARVLPRYRGYSPALVDRMLQDLVFDHAAARQDLGFDPRTFSPGPDDVRGS